MLFNGGSIVTVFLQSEDKTHLKRKWGEPSTMRASIAVRLEEDMKIYKDLRTGEQTAEALEKQTTDDSPVGGDDQAMDLSSG